MSIRWNIRDRATGDHLIVENPYTFNTKRGVECHVGEADNLKAIIKNCSSVGISPLGQFNNSLKG